MFNLMTQNWWAIALRGLVAVLFGIATFVWPGITLWVLVALFGAYALINGIFAVIEAFRRDVSRERWWGLLFEGVVGILIGVVTLTWPGFLLLAFPATGALSVILIIGAFAFATGALMIALAFKLRSLRRPGGEVPTVRHAEPSH
jgi:uncharacterized membrane protein HdeD (DUF308 family)